MTAWREFECPDCGALCNNQVMHLCSPEAKLARLKAEVLELRKHAAGAKPPGFYGRAYVRLHAEYARLANELETWKNLERLQGQRAIEAEKKLGDIQSCERSTQRVIEASMSEERIVDPQELVDRANCYEADHEFTDAHLLKLGAQEIRRLEAQQDDLRAQVLALQSCEVDSKRYHTIRAAFMDDSVMEMLPDTGDNPPQTPAEFDARIDKVTERIAQSQPQPDHIANAGKPIPAPLPGGTNAEPHVCEHQWDGEEEYIEYPEGGCSSSATCSRCGMSAMSHAMWCF